MQNQNWKKNAKSIRLLKLNELRKEGWKKKKFKNQQFIFVDYHQIFVNVTLKEMVKTSLKNLVLEFAGQRSWPNSELFQAFGPKKINLLKWPDGQSKSSGFVTLASKEKAQESIDRLNMKITLEGSLMPLAVKFSGGSRKRSRTDFDAPANGNSKSSPKTWVELGTILIFSFRFVQ